MGSTESKFKPVATVRYIDDNDGVCSIPFRDLTETLVSSIFDRYKHCKSVCESLGKIEVLGKGESSMYSISAPMRSLEFFMQETSDLLHWERMSTRKRMSHEQASLAELLDLKYRVYNTHKKMECANCCKTGHTFRDCKEPVTSYGVCAVKIIESVPYYLLIRRRDSISYVEFLRGKYTLDNVDYIQLLFNGMTLEERNRLLEMRFDILWEQLWNNQNTRQFRNEYEIAKKNYDALKYIGDIYGKLMASYAHSTITTWSEPEWGFPKGRRTLHETELRCALREFQEETGLASKTVKVCTDESPLCEEYVGTNKISYRQIYFIGICAPDSTVMHQPFNRVMVREVGDIGFYPFEVAIEKIRPTNIEKRNLLQVLHNRIMHDGLCEKLQSSLHAHT